MIVGVDLDTWKLTLCALDDELVAWETADLRSRARSEKLLDAILGTQHAIPLAVARLIIELERQADTSDESRDIYGRDIRLTEVYIERARGMFRTADFDLGAIYGATAVAFGRALPGAHVGSMEIALWKREVTAAMGVKTKRGDPGNANASKELANGCCLAILDGLGRRPDEPLSPDELDAFGIAYAARAIRAGATA